MARRRKQSLAADKNRIEEIVTEPVPVEEAEQETILSHDVPVHTVQMVATGETILPSTPEGSMTTTLSESSTFSIENGNPIFQVICSSTGEEDDGQPHTFQVVDSGLPENSQILFITDVTESRKIHQQTPQRIAPKIEEFEVEECKNYEADEKKVDVLPLLSEIVAHENQCAVPMVLKTLDGKPVESGSKVFIQPDENNPIPNFIQLPPGCEIFNVPASFPTLLKATQSSVTFSNSNEQGEDIEMIGVKKPTENEMENPSNRPCNVRTMSTIDFHVPGSTNTVHVNKFMFSPNLCRVCLLEKENVVSIFEDVSIDSSGMIVNSRGPHAASRYKLIPAIQTLLNIEVEK